MESFEEFCSKTVIATATYNRKQITEVCLKNLSSYRKNAALWIFDDHSTDIAMEELSIWAPGAEVFREPTKLGIEKLRLAIHRKAVSSGFKYIYHTDNDAYHDPNWLTRLYDIRQTHDGLIGLYNTNLHYHNNISQTDSLIMRKACPGISFFYEISKLKECPDKIYNSWDYVFGDKLAPAAISKVSYVEHFGAGGIHNKDFDRDRAANPTPWLMEQRSRLIPLLKG
jgi:hypothetical protein